MSAWLIGIDLPMRPGFGIAPVQPAEEVRETVCIQAWNRGWKVNIHAIYPGEFAPRGSVSPR